MPIDSQDLDYYEEMGKASADFTTVATSQYDYSIMHYTSGTTGKPKGAVHRHQAVVQQYATGKWALDLHEDDIYWCTADPGWVTGTSYGMLAPWTNGVTQLIYEGGFRASAWYEQIQKHNVTVWYTAPTAIRMLMKAGDDVPKRYDLSSLRFTASVGEPLNPEAVVWGGGGDWTRVPRQLVADGDRRDNVRQLRIYGYQAGLYGEADTRHRIGYRR